MCRSGSVSPPLLAHGSRRRGAADDAIWVLGVRLRRKMHFLSSYVCPRPLSSIYFIYLAVLPPLSSILLLHLAVLPPLSSILSSI